MIRRLVYVVVKLVIVFLILVLGVLEKGGIEKGLLILYSGSSTLSISLFL